MRPLHDRVLALAGVVQAAALVSEAANGASTDETSLRATLGSILKLESPDVPQVFGGLEGVRLGLQEAHRAPGAGARP